jgi:hypothetical protein
MTKKAQVVSCRLHTEELAALDLIASQQRLNRSETLRWLIRLQATQLHLWPPDSINLTKEKRG